MGKPNPDQDAEQKDVADILTVYTKRLDRHGFLATRTIERPLSSRAFPYYSCNLQFAFLRHIPGIIDSVLHSFFRHAP